MEYSKELAYKWSLYLDSVDLSYDLNTERGIITVPDVSVDSEVKQCTVMIICRESDFTVHAVLKQKVPVTTRDQVSNLMARLNWTLYFGKFAMDYSDGEVALQYSVDFEDSVASMQMLRNALAIPLRAIEKWGNAIMEVSSGKMRAQAAFSKYK